MDPLSIIASSISIADALSKSLEFVRATRKAPQELFALYNEISDLVIYLKDLFSQLQRDSAEREQVPPTIRLLEAANKALSKLEALSGETKAWADVVHSDSLKQQVKQFRVLRVARKACKYREELRRVRQELCDVSSLSSL